MSEHPTVFEIELVPSVFREVASGAQPYLIAMGAVEDWHAGCFARVLEVERKPALWWSHKRQEWEHVYEPGADGYPTERELWVRVTSVTRLYERDMTVIGFRLCDEPKITLEDED